MISRQSSGRSRYIRLRIMVLIATDLPEPVVPAISRCGMRAILTITGSPPIVFPRQRGRRACVSLYSLASSISRSSTISRFGVGRVLAAGLAVWKGPRWRLYLSRRPKFELGVFVGSLGFDCPVGGRSGVLLGLRPGTGNGGEKVAHESEAMPASAGKH